MSLSQMPTSVRTFCNAMRDSDIFAAMSTLVPTAYLIDNNKVYLSADVSARLYEITATQLRNMSPVSAYERSGRYTVIVIEDESSQTIGNWQFILADGKIEYLDMVTMDLSILPEPIGAFIAAVNAENLDEFTCSFAEDALVNDQLRDYWGRDKIVRWAIDEIIGEHLRIQVIDVIRHHGHVIVTAIVDGTFEKKGLPDPLILAFHFFSIGDKIVQLMILRNHIGP